MICGIVTIFFLIIHIIFSNRRHTLRI